MYSLFLDIKYGLINLWKYRKIIWNDRDFDHFYLLELVEFKLRNMSDMQKNHGHSTVSKDISEELLEAADLVKQLKDDDFMDYSHIDEKFGELEFLDNTLKRPLEYDNEEEIARLTLEEMHRSNKEKQRVQRKLFNLLKKYENWWD